MSKSGLTEEWATEKNNCKCRLMTTETRGTACSSVSCIKDFTFELENLHMVEWKYSNRRPGASLALGTEALYQKSNKLSQAVKGSCNREKEQTDPKDPAWSWLPEPPKKWNKNRITQQYPSGLPNTKCKQLREIGSQCELQTEEKKLLLDKRSQTEGPKIDVLGLKLSDPIAGPWEIGVHIWKDVMNQV